MRYAIGVLGCFASVLFNISAAVSQERIFVGDSGAPAVLRAGLDGTKVTTVIDGGDGLLDPQGLAADTESSKVYFADPTAGTISRANLDGSGLEQVLTGRVSPLAVAISSANRKIYWTETLSGMGRVMRANLDGTSPEQIALGDVSGIFRGIAIDNVNGKVYWSNPAEFEINRADLDGTNVESVVAVSGPAGLAVDPVNGKLYWADTTLNTIGSSNLDGTGVVIELISAVITPRFVAVDLENGKLYFSRGSPAGVSRAELDGTGVAEIIDDSEGLITPTGIAVFGGPAIVTPGTVLEDPPAVAISDNDVTLTLQEFAGAAKQDLAGALRRAARARFAFRYDVRVNASTSGDNRKKLSKKNKVTFKNLRPGSYTTTYRVNIFKRRSKTAQKKAESRGKSGFSAKFKPAGRTGFSPAAGFNIP